MGMDRRNGIRSKVNEPVSLTVLDPCGMPTLQGTMVDIAGNGMCIDLPSPVPCGSPVRITTQDMVMEGQVKRCEPAGESHRVALHLEHPADV